MKKLILTLLCGLIFQAGAYAGADEITMDVTRLPETAQQFVKKYFKDAQIAHIKIEKNVLQQKSYDVKFVNGNEIEFDNEGQWTDVDCEKSALPAGIVPAKIAAYMKKNLPDEKAVSISKDRWGYELKTASDLELKFDTKGTFKSVDD
ncbi:MAG: PepSY-like domain-containing protein [Rikenellaceae bacterium]|nr:PepSY-like domain-containing protein [Rikenellaceae bacterium]